VLLFQLGREFTVKRNSAAVDAQTQSPFHGALLKEPLRSTVAHVMNCVVTLITAVVRFFTRTGAGTPAGFGIGG